RNRLCHRPRNSSLRVDFHHGPVDGCETAGTLRRRALDGGAPGGKLQANDQSCSEHKRRAGLSSSSGSSSVRTYIRKYAIFAKILRRQNIQHPTSNAEHRTKCKTMPHWELDVG